MEIESAVDKAISEMPEDFEIRMFLIGHKSEVKSMCLTEYNEAETMEMFKAEAREEGLAEGRKEGRAEERLHSAVLFVQDKLEDDIPRDKIIEKLVRLYGMKEREAKELIEKCSKPESAG